MGARVHQVAIVWFRNDLRLHDNYSLCQAAKSASTLLPVYFFDPRFQTAQSKSRVANLERAGANRLQFLIESVDDLKSSLEAHRSTLVVRVGRPELELPQMARELGATLIVGHKELASEETRVETRLKRAAQTLDLRVELLWDNTMVHLDDLAFELQHVPDTFTSFRKQVEAKSPIRAPVQAPKIPPLPESYHQSLREGSSVLASSDYSLQALGVSEQLIVAMQQAKLALAQQPHKSLCFKGGERAGLARLDQYFFQQDLLKSYKDIRNGMLGADYSSKFSPWLATGSLSAREVYAAVKRYEAQRLSNDSTYWMVFELLWRDYFRFWSYKVGNKLFSLQGPKDRADLSWKQDPALFQAWCQGRTGFPLVDGCMRELASTGFMSNRGRQNVCSFLTRDLGLDWRLGAEWFENQLLDYDVYSNWGNWVYGAGVGNDPRDNRYFNIMKQAAQYDPKGEFVRAWCPELQHVPDHLIHCPWKMSASEQTRYHCKLGSDYPKPIVRLVAGMNPWTGSKKPFR